MTNNAGKKACCCPLGQAAGERELSALSFWRRAPRTHLLCRRCQTTAAISHSSVTRSRESSRAPSVDTPAPSVSTTHPNNGSFLQVKINTGFSLICLPLERRPRSLLELQILAKLCFLRKWFYKTYSRKTGRIYVTPLLSYQ